MSEPPQDPESTEIEAILDRWFELEHAGANPSLDAICRDAPHLLPRIRELLELQSTLLTPVEPRPQRPSILIERLGDYELKTRIGSGGMGDVYLARQTSLDRFVALKVLRQDLGGDPARRLRFRREAQITAALDHPNIVPIYETGEVSGHAYIAMKHLEGQTLEVTSPSWPPRRVAKIGAQIARALHSAHEVGIVHRDIKPTNILVEGDHPYVLDFGLARGRIDLTLTAEGQIPGTLAYMPPEQLRGHGLAIDPRTDVYALGATLYQCLTGHPPFRDEEPAVLVPRILASDPEPLRLASRDRDLETVLTRALDKSVARRFPTALAFAEDLEAFAEDRPIRSRPPSLIHRLSKFGRRHRVASTAVATALLAAIVASIVISAEFRESARRRAAERDRQLDIANSFLDADRPGSAILRIREIAQNQPLDDLDEPRLADLAARATSALVREMLLDELQADRLYANDDSLTKIEADLEGCHPAILNDGKTNVARLLLAHRTGDTARMRSVLDSTTELAEYPRFRAAMNAIDNGNRATEGLRRLEQEQPATESTNADDHAFAAMVLHIDESSRQAIQAEYSAALALDPYHVRARYGHAIRHSRSDDHPRAQEALEMMLREDEPRPFLHIAIARLATRNRDFDAASRSIDAAKAAVRDLDLPPMLRLTMAEVGLALTRRDLDKTNELIDAGRKAFGPSEWFDITAGYSALLRGDEASARKLLGRAASNSRTPWNRRRAEAALIRLELNAMLDSGAATTDAIGALLHRSRSLLEDSQRTHDKRNIAEAATSLFILFDALGRTEDANAALETALEAEELHATATHQSCEAILNDVSARVDVAPTDLALGDRSGDLRRRASILVERQLKNGGLMTPLEHFELAVTACSLSAAVGDTKLATRMGAIANSVAERAPDSTFHAVLDFARKDLGLESWPDPTK